MIPQPACMCAASTLISALACSLRPVVPQCVGGKHVTLFSGRERLSARTIFWSHVHIIVVVVMVTPPTPGLDPPSRLELKVSNHNDKTKFVENL